MNLAVFFIVNLVKFANRMHEATNEIKMLDNMNLTKIVISFVAGFILCYLLFIFRAEATQELALTNALGGGVGLAVGYYIYEKYVKE